MQSNHLNVLARFCSHIICKQQAAFLYYWYVVHVFVYNTFAWHPQTYTTHTTVKIHLDYHLYFIFRCKIHYVLTAYAFMFPSGQRVN